MNARTETLAEVIDWLGDEADREWERAKDGLSDGYDGFDAYTRAIQHCQDMIVEDEASSGKHTKIALLKHLADTFDETSLGCSGRTKAWMIGLPSLRPPHSPSPSSQGRAAGPPFPYAFKGVQVMPTPSSYPPEPSLDAIEGRATFDGHVIRLERWGREADRRRCAYAAAPIGSVRGARVMTTPDAAFLVIDVVAPDSKATGIPTRPGALARSVWTLRVPDPAKADRFAGMVARHAPAEAVPLERAPRADRRPVLLIAVAAMLAASLAVLGGWTAYEAGQPEPVRTKVVKRTVVRERIRTVTSCPTPAPPTAQEQAPAATTEPETDAAPQSQPTQSDDSQNQSQSTDTDSGTHVNGQDQTQEGESDVSRAEGSQAGQ